VAALSSLGGLFSKEHSSLQFWLPQAEKILGFLRTAMTALSSLGGFWVCGFRVQVVGFWVLGFRV
jgi:hypothetical protein